jgi:hypothetical protein
MTRSYRDGTHRGGPFQIVRVMPANGDHACQR